MTVIREKGAARRSEWKAHVDGRPWRRAHRRRVKRSRSEARTTLDAVATPHTVKWSACFRHALLPRGEREEREGELPRILRKKTSAEGAPLKNRTGGDAMAKIVRAVDGVSGIPAGFPILLDDGMTIIEPAFAFLLELATVPGRSHSPETLRTYAEHLHDWFDSLEQSDLDWRTVDEGTIAAYRNRMLSAPSQHTRRPYARSTINDRVGTVCRFYVWAQRHRLIAELPFGYVDVSVRSSRPQRMLAHLDRRPAIVSANVLTIAEAEALPRPLRVDQLRRLFAALDPPYGLVAQWALATGMRRKELCGLELSQIPVVAHFDVARNPLVGLPLIVTKGDRPRTAYPPLRLIDRTHWYIGEERAALVKRLRRARPSYRPPTVLFLNASGAPVTRARLSAVFSKAFQKAGLEGSGHWLRHTFAMTMLVCLQRQAMTSPDLNPLKIVQVLLGHASIQSTAVYLRCVEVHSEALAESLAFLYGEVIGDDGS